MDLPQVLRGVELFQGLTEQELSKVAKNVQEKFIKVLASLQFNWIKKVKLLSATYRFDVYDESNQGNNSRDSLTHNIWYIAAVIAPGSNE